MNHNKKRGQVFWSVWAMALTLALGTGLGGAAGPGASLAQGPQPQGGPYSYAFTYQGHLQGAGGPVDGTCDFEFSLWDAAGSGIPPSGGTQIGTTQQVVGVTLTDGLFSVALSFGGSAFDGAARWLAIAVRCPAGIGSYTTLSPRQPLTAAPYALGVQPGAVIHNQASAGPVSGLSLQSNAGDGLQVTSAGKDGVYVDWAGGDGMYVYRSIGDGFHVNLAGGNGLGIFSADANGLYVKTAGTHGVYVEAAGLDGVHLETAGTPSTTSASADVNGIEVEGAQGHGLWVGRADLDGVIVYSAGDDGVYVASAGDIGVYADTIKASHNYGFSTPDNLYSLNYHLAGAVMHLAQNGGGEPLEPGDVVIFSGVAAPLEKDGPPVVQVARATVANSTAVAGVVYSRFDVEALAARQQPAGPASDVTLEGPVPPGAYLLLVVQGPARVKASQLSGAIRPGDLLGSADQAGYAAKAREVSMEGIGVAVPGTILGKALAPLDTDQGLIYIFVTLQ